MKKYFLLLFLILLFAGCQKPKNYDLIFDMQMNCYQKVYEFDDGTKIYSSYSDIQYKKGEIKIPIQEALDKDYLTLSDIKNRDEFKIVKDNSTLNSCNNE